MQNLIEQIFTEKDGGNFSRLKDKLIKNYTPNEREKVIAVLMQYVKEGRILHWRNFLLTDIIELINEGEICFSDFWEWAITDNQLAYWSIDGLLKTKEKEAYPEIVSIALSGDYPLSVRAKAIKSIALISKQPFDRELSVDPGYWKEEQLRLAEITDWQKNGYPDGIGYSEPKVHPSLKNPQTKFEKLVAKLEKKLETKRKKYQDLSNPDNWLVIADSEDIMNIEQRWNLPEEYLTFLKYYSPLKVFITNKNFPQGIDLYGASDLINSQLGYSYNPVKEEKIADWQDNLLVIADCDADPYCLDLNNGQIYTSMHGQGEWEFELYADSFTDFLKDLI